MASNVGRAGLRANPDFNDWEAPQEGFGRFAVNEKNGERCSAATGCAKRQAPRAPPQPAPAS